MKTVSQIVNEMYKSGGFKIGEYTIYDSGFNPDSFWIEHESGEGSGFPKKDIEKLIDKYYKDNF